MWPRFFPGIPEKSFQSPGPPIPLFKTPRRRASADLWIRVRRGRGRWPEIRLQRIRTKMLKFGRKPQLPKRLRRLMHAGSRQRHGGRVCAEQNANPLHRSARAQQKLRRTECEVCQVPALETRGRTQHFVSAKGRHFILAGLRFCCLQKAV